MGPARHYTGLVCLVGDLPGVGDMSEWGLLGVISSLCVLLAVYLLWVSP